LCASKHNDVVASLTNDLDSVEVDPVPTFNQLEELPGHQVTRPLEPWYSFRSHLVQPSGDDSAGTIGSFSKVPVNLDVSIPPKMTEPKQSVSRRRKEESEWTKKLTPIAVDTTDIEAKSPAINESLIVKIIKNNGVRAIPS
jgi:hypothetical protein